MATTDEAIITALERILSLEERVNELLIWKMASKDIISRLMAHIAIIDGDKDTILKEFSAGGDHISDRLSAEEFSDIAERMRQQKDLLVANARSLLREEK